MSPARAAASGGASLPRSGPVPGVYVLECCVMWLRGPLSCARLGFYSPLCVGELSLSGLPPSGPFPLLLALCVPARCPQSGQQ